MLGGMGVLPSVASGSGDGTPSATPAPQRLGPRRRRRRPSTQPSPPARPPPTQAAGGPSGQESAASGSDASGDAPQDAPATTTSHANPPSRRTPATGSGSSSTRATSGSGWSTTTTTVARTYLVSGSLYDNLDPGTYSVYSRSEQAYGVDDSGTMKYFVRFTEGPKGAAIGFHDIPIAGDQLVQTVDQLGTPQSHGCIRQEREDAIALWEFAPVGTEVQVTA